MFKDGSLNKNVARRDGARVRSDDARLREMAREEAEAKFGERKSKSSLLSDLTLEMGFFETRHRWTILVARWVSFSAVTRMLCAFLIESGRRCNNSVRRY